ncbi:hypothetical protein GCM10022259_08480 [Aquimarina mytili]
MVSVFFEIRQCLQKIENSSGTCYTKQILQYYVYIDSTNQKCCIMQTLKKWLLLGLFLIAIIACGEKKKETETTIEKAETKNTAVVTKTTKKKTVTKPLSKKELRKIKRELRKREREQKRKQRELENNKK